MPNTELLIDSLAHIELEPELWNQEVWLEPKGTIRVSPERVQEVRDADHWDRVLLDDTEITASCGTACCLAGWANLLGGARVTWLVPGYLEVDDNGVLNTGADVDVHEVRLPDGYVYREPGNAAEELLDINRFTSDYRDLFYCENDLDDLYEIAADIFGVPESELRERVAARVADLRAQRESAGVQG